MDNAKTTQIYVMGKAYDVPTGITIMDAMEYAGYRFTRGAGCRSGFCGACGTVYRKEGSTGSSSPSPARRWSRRGCT